MSTPSRTATTNARNFPDASSQSARCENKNLHWNLFWVSALGLFLELMLIRWVSTEIRIFAYLQNTVLVVCFLGLGMGCLTSRRTARVGQAFGPLAFLLVLMAIPATRGGLEMITSLLNSLGDMVIWGYTLPMGLGHAVFNVVLGLLLTFVLMSLLWQMFVPLGRCLGRWMDESTNIIAAYSWNVGGSLCGVLLFSLLSVLQQPPIVWCVCLAALFVPLADWKWRQQRWEVASLAIVILSAWFAGVMQTGLETHWSPYQKLTLCDIQEQKVTGEGDTLQRVGKYLVMVNQSGYQAMVDLSPAHVAAHPELFSPSSVGLGQYDVPCQFHPRPKRVLVVGAGSGNDVAGALRNGAEEVVAVEIDPAIIALGKQYHPERPYDSPRVQVVLDDARSFMATTRERFDVILFGLLDSHTTSAMTNARLDHYVYTRESLEQAKSLLNDDGVLVLSFEVQKPFIASRMERLLTEIFSAEPLRFRIETTNLGWGGVMFVTGNLRTVHQQLAAHPRLAKQVDEWVRLTDIERIAHVEVTTDDWPYLYLESRHIPVLYFLLGGLLLALFARGLWLEQSWSLVTQWQRSHWHFFFLGAAFMLLEVQNISKACVVLGSTWWVNAVIISAILIMVLAANFLALRFRNIPERAVYAGLCLTCVGLYFIDLASFAFLPFLAKTVWVGALTCLPILFSGVVFIRSLAVVQRKDLALGANLFGSLLGALLQSVTFIVGIKALLLFVVGLYLLAFATRARPGATKKSAFENNTKAPLASEASTASTISPTLKPDDATTTEAPAVTAG